MLRANAGRMQPCRAVRGIPKGDAAFRYGTYPRVRPPGTLIARWYCPLARRTVSALPDCLASNYSGALVELEAIVLAVAQAPALSRAADVLRTDIELPLNAGCRCGEINFAFNMVKALFYKMITYGRRQNNHQNAKNPYHC